MENVLRRNARASKIAASFLLGATFFALAGCATDSEKAATLVTQTGAAIAKVQAAHAAIQHKEADQDYSALYALSQPNGAELAKRFLNDSLTLAGPTGTAQAELEQEVKDLLVQNAKAFTALQKSEAANATLKQNLADATTQAKKAITSEQAALVADAKKADTLNSYNSWFGLTGLAHYFTHSVLVLLGVLAGVIVLVLLLRLFSSTSPLAEACLGVIESILAIPVKFFSWVIPGALNAAGWCVSEIEAELSRPSATTTPTNPTSPKA